jgi:hypothetical protein
MITSTFDESSSHATRNH